ncbi:MAG: M48 family metalloprotease [Acetobacteraceae bacterium]|nr:M48 family metalloprotease [Acetobacteraceae bacterium]
MEATAAAERRGGAPPRGRHLLLLAVAACAARPAPPAIDAAEVEAARRSIAAAPPPAAQPRSAEGSAAMLASAAGRVAAAAEPVCAAHLNRACAFTVRLDPSDTPRAAAHGQGQVTLTAGMVRLVETEDELAAVVAHEFGHHIAGHLGRQRARGTVAGTVASTVVGAVVPFGGLAGLVIGQGAAQLGAGAARLAYSKAEEREADYLGAYLVARAGYDLERAGDLWARLARPDAAARGGGVAGLLATHPAEAERLAAWRRTAEEIRASPDLMPRRAGAAR